MKKVLLILSLMVPAWLYSCTGTKPPVPTPATVVQQAHEAFPTVTLAPPVVIKKKPVVKHTPKPKPNTVKRKVAPVAPQVEELPPQQGVICIFPLNMLPNCTPQASQ